VNPQDCRQVERRVDLQMLCPYEPGKPVAEVQRELGLGSVIKLASNENPLGPSPRAIETLNRTDLELHMYPDFDGWALRQALATRLGVTPDEIVLGAGSSELMRLIADAYLERGQEAILADLCFPVYQNVTRIAGATPIIVPVDSDLNQDLGRMLSAVTPRTRVVFLASPNNPTGRLIPFPDLVAFLERLPLNVLCVVDLAYWEYVDADPAAEPVTLLRRYPNLVLLRTFSKVYGLAGLRVGYAVSNVDVTGWLCRMRIPFNVCTAAQVAAQVALDDRAHVCKAIELNRTVRKDLDDGASRIGFVAHPSDANFMLLEGERNAEDVFQTLLRRGFIVRPMRHPRLRRSVRVTTGTREQIAGLLSAMADLAGPT
jgi:histidinol-phosphate aminotransferase